MAYKGGVTGTPGTPWLRPCFQILREELKIQRVPDEVFFSNFEVLENVVKCLLSCVFDISSILNQIKTKTREKARESSRKNVC